MKEGIEPRHPGSDPNVLTYFIFVSATHFCIVNNTIVRVEKHGTKGT